MRRKFIFCYLRIKFRIRTLNFLSDGIQTIVLMYTQLSIFSGRFPFYLHRFRYTFEFLDSVRLLQKYSYFSECSLLKFINSFETKLIDFKINSQV